MARVLKHFLWYFTSYWHNRKTFQRVDERTAPKNWMTLLVALMKLQNNNDCLNSMLTLESVIKWIKRNLPTVRTWVRISPCSMSLKRLSSPMPMQMQTPMQPIQTPMPMPTPTPLKKRRRNPRFQNQSESTETWSRPNNSAMQATWSRTNSHKMQTWWHPLRLLKTQSTKSMPISSTECFPKIGQTILSSSGYKLAVMNLICVLKAKSTSSISASRCWNWVWWTRWSSSISLILPARVSDSPFVILALSIKLANLQRGFGGFGLGVWPHRLGETTNPCGPTPSPKQWVRVCDWRCLFRLFNLPFIHIIFTSHLSITRGFGVGVFGYRLGEIH